MALVCDVELHDLWKLLYGNEMNGVWEGDFIRNEKERGIILPNILKNFLKGYGYFPINGNGFAFCYPPDQMELCAAQVDGCQETLCLMGRKIELTAAIRLTELQEDDPFLVWGFPSSIEDEGSSVKLKWAASHTRLSGFLKQLFCLNLISQRPVHFLISQKEQAEFLARHGLDSSGLRRLTPDVAGEYISVCWEEERELFLAAFYDKHGELRDLAQIPRNISPAAGGKYASLDLTELETLFKKEFYANSTNCDFRHALELLQEIISRMEQDKATGWELGRRYSLAGRCCWVLQEWTAASLWYAKAAPLIGQGAPSHPEEASSFYLGLSSFLFYFGNTLESREAFEKGLLICRKYGDSKPRILGNLLQQRGVCLSEDEETFSLAMKRFDQALEEYQKDPGDCKYDIARCRQLRGDLKRRIKELGRT